MIETKLQHAEVVAIVGPTASGKTALSIELAKNITVKSLMVIPCKFIKGSILGQLKLPKKRWRAFLIIYLAFRAYRIFFGSRLSKLVRAKIAEIQARQKLPIIVGGSGLYVQAVLYDFQFTDEK